MWHGQLKGLLSACVGVLLVFLLMERTSFSSAQEPPKASADSGVLVSERELDALASDARRSSTELKPSNSPTPSPGINFFQLLIRGGWFMVPIGLVSLLVVTVAFERAIVLRRSRIIPSGLVRAIGALARESESLDPKATYRLCQQFPSATANVIRTMLLKIGRPHAEIENAIRESTQREADRAYAGVRWLGLSAGIAPLLGLLGTVWGLMRSFHDLSQIGPSQNRGQFLSQGIYEALITTLAGLIVAITASFLAHYFEGKILNIFRQVDELMFHLQAQVESYEGKVRFDAVGKDLQTRDGSDVDRSLNAGDRSGSLAATPYVAKTVLPSSTTRRSPPAERRDGRGT